MQSIEDEAVVLGSTDYGDSDKIVSLFTCRHGKVSAFAPGARRSKKRFSGALDVGTYLNARWVEGRGESVRLEAVDLKNSFFHLRVDLGAIARSAYCLELCRELVREGEPHGMLFRLLIDYLTLLDAKEAGPTSLLAFVLRALDLAGLRPVFSACALCGHESDEFVRFDPTHGGVLCGSCSARSPFGTRVPQSLIVGLDAIQKGRKEKLDPLTRGQARELLNSFIEHHLGRRLKSVEFMRQIEVD